MSDAQEILSSIDEAGKDMTPAAWLHIEARIEHRSRQVRGARAYFTEFDDMTQVQTPTHTRHLRNKSSRSRQVRGARARNFVRALARLNNGPLKDNELAAAQADLREQARASGALDELQRLQRQQYASRSSAA